MDVKVHKARGEKPAAQIHGRLPGLRHQCVSKGGNPAFAHPEVARWQNAVGQNQSGVSKQHGGCGSLRAESGMEAATEICASLVDRVSDSGPCRAGTRLRTAVGDHTSEKCSPAWRFLTTRFFLIRLARASEFLRQRGPGRSGGLIRARGIRQPPVTARITRREKERQQCGEPCGLVVRQNGWACGQCRKIMALDAPRINRCTSRGDPRAVPGGWCGRERGGF